MEPDRSIDPRPEPGGRRARRAGRAGRLLWRGTRVLIGPLVVTGAVFGMVFASAGSDRGQTSIDDAQPIDYYEECQKEGCSRHEVVELWQSFQTECIEEDCWMEEVAELAGGTVEMSEFGNWYYTKAHYVAEMMDYFVRELGHREAREVPVREGFTDTAWRRMWQRILDEGVEVSFECTNVEGDTYDCGTGVSIG